jgi:hypothetical protein
MFCYDIQCSLILSAVTMDISRLTIFLREMVSYVIVKDTQLIKTDQKVDIPYLCFKPFAYCLY